jgi:hypothetical protein
MSKPMTPPKLGMTPHRHYWHYLHAVWSSSKGHTLAARYCVCGVVQAGRVMNWRKTTQRASPDIYDAMRQDQT